MHVLHMGLCKLSGECLKQSMQVVTDKSPHGSFTTCLGPFDKHRRKYLFTELLHMK